MGGNWYNGFWHHNNKQGNHKQHYGKSKPREYVVCQSCDRWVYCDRKIKVCPCGLPYGESPCLEGSQGNKASAEVKEALGVLGSGAATKPIADLLKSLLASAGVVLDEEAAVEMSHSQQVKFSLATQKKCVDKVH